jgi:hypothetical protein
MQTRLSPDYFQHQVRSAEVFGDALLLWYSEGRCAQGGWQMA